jgi:hypothetical protein
MRDYFSWGYEDGHHGGPPCKPNNEDYMNGYRFGAVKQNGYCFGADRDEEKITLNHIKAFLVITSVIVFFCIIL